MRLSVHMIYAYDLLIERSENVSRNVLHGFENLVIWLWKSFGNMLRVVCVDPVMHPGLHFSSFESDNSNVPNALIQF